MDSRRTSAMLAASSGEAQDRLSEMPGHRTTQMVIRHDREDVPNLDPA